MANFCGGCGKELNEGAPCDCVNHNEETIAEQSIEQAIEESTLQSIEHSIHNFQENKEQEKTKEAEWLCHKSSEVISKAKNMFREILPILRNPITATKRIAERDTAKIGLEFMILKAFIILLVVLFGAARVSNLMGGYIKMPYGQLTLIALLLTIGVDWLEGILLKVISGFFNVVTKESNMFVVVGSRALYDTFLLALFGLFALFSIKAALFVFIIGSLILPCIQFGSYQFSVQGDEDKKVYAYFIAKACVTCIMYLIIYLLAKDIVSNMLGGMVNNLFGSFSSFF